MATYTAIVEIENSQGQMIAVSTIPNFVQPAGMEVEIEDISASDAGRTADTIMHKKTLRTVRALSLAWHNLRTAQAKAVLQAFNTKEYFKVKYLDPYSGGYITKTFYLGNRTAPMYSAVLDVWSNISFKIVER